MMNKCFWTRAFFSSLFLMALLGTSRHSHAGIGSSLMQTAPVLPTGSYEGKLHTDIILSRGGGLNILPHFRTGLVDGFLDLDLFIGAGKTDFQSGLKLKYNLLPDLHGQIGLSFYGGYTYMRDDLIDGAPRQNLNLFTLGALASKRYVASFGHLEPYVSLEFEYLSYPGDYSTPLTLIVGAFWEFSQSSQWSFYTEGGIKLRKSVNMVALGLSYSF